MVGRKSSSIFAPANKETAVTNYGGSIAAMMMPDKDGKMGDVIHGFDNIQDMLKGHQPFLSTLVGRYGNRIKEGRYTLNGKEYQFAYLHIRLPLMIVFGIAFILKHLRYVFCRIPSFQQVQRDNRSVQAIFLLFFEPFFAGLPVHLHTIPLRLG